MRPPKFDYYRPSSVGEAIELLATHDNAKALAGGHSLIPAMNLRLAQPEVLVDLGHLEDLRAITVSDHSISIGALCTHRRIAASAHVQAHSAALASAAGKIGDAQVRNWGTIGGNLAHADPAADLPTAVLACGGTIHLQGQGGARSVPAEDFFIDVFTVDLMPGELIVSIELPMMANTRSAYAKFAHPASHFSLVGVGVALTIDGNTCTAARVAVGGSVPKATRCPSAEAVLQGSTLDAATLDQAAEGVAEDIAGSLMGDIFAPEDYRKTVTQAYFKRAVQDALGNTGGM